MRIALTATSKSGRSCSGEQQRVTYQTCVQTEPESGPVSENTIRSRGQTSHLRRAVTRTQLVYGVLTQVPLLEWSSLVAVIKLSRPPQAISVLLHVRNDQLARRLQSALFVNYSMKYFISTSTYSITCSSETESDSLLSSFSGKL